MNATNRVVNRLVLCAVGIVLLGTGAAAIAATLWREGSEIWQTGVSAVRDWIVNADTASRIAETGTVSWFALGFLALLLLIVVVAVIVISRLGGGRTSSMVREGAGDGVQGSVTITHGFASDAITTALDGREDVLSSRVTARRVDGTNVLHVSVTPRQNTSPADIAHIVTLLVGNLATLTGRETPTLVSIRSGIRSKIAADQSRVR